MMTSQGVIVKVKTENQEYLWKEWGNEMDTWHVHVYLTTKIHQMVHNLILLWQQSCFQSLFSLIPV